MRVAEKTVAATKSVPFRAILTVCMILLVCDGCRLGPQEPKGGLTYLQIFGQVPFSHLQRLNNQTKGRGAS
jgi:hypothetical protein